MSSENRQLLLGNIIISFIQNLNISEFFYNALIMLFPGITSKCTLFFLKYI